MGMKSSGLESLLRPRVAAGLEVSLKPLTLMFVGIVLKRRSELPDMLWEHAVSNLIVISGGEVQALKQTGSVNAEEMGHKVEVEDSEVEVED